MSTREERDIARLMARRGRLPRGYLSVWPQIGTALFILMILGLVFGRLRWLWRLAAAPARTPDGA